MDAWRQGRHDDLVLAAAVAAWTAAELPVVYLMRIGCRAERVTGFNNSFRTLGLIKPEFFRFASFDKTEIEGALYRPKGLAEGKRAPLFVHVHGGPTGAFGD